MRRSQACSLLAEQALKYLLDFFRSIILSSNLVVQLSPDIIVKIVPSLEVIHHLVRVQSLLILPSIITLLLPRLFLVLPPAVGIGGRKGGHIANRQL